MALPTTQEEKTASRDNSLVLAALGILAYAASTMTHEALGHGMYCLAANGHNTMLTAWQETCAFPGVAPLGVKAAGPAAQFAAGLLAWAALHLGLVVEVRLRYFLWLYMTYSLFIVSSYIAFSGMTDFGDAAELIAGAHPHTLWRIGLVLLGCVLYLFCIVPAAAELNLFTGPLDKESRLYGLVWIPYVSIGVFACCTAALNKTMGTGDAISLASLSSFGSGAGLFCLPNVYARFAGKRQSQTAYIPWSMGWVIAAALVILIFVVLIGPGLQ